jgi:starch synthase
LALGIQVIKLNTNNPKDQKAKNADPMPFAENADSSDQLTPSNLHIFFASSEVEPFARTGGLGDVLGSLPKALERLGARVSIIMPAYRSVLQGNFDLQNSGIQFNIPVSNRIEKASLLKSKMGNNIQVYFVKADQYFDREDLYGTSTGDYADNAERFTFFSSP